MKNAQELRIGNVCIVNNEPMVVLKSEYNKSGRSSAVVKLKLKNFKANQKYQVYDINGMLIEASIINGQSDLSNDLSGIYLLRVLNFVKSAK